MFAEFGLLFLILAFVSSGLQTVSGFLAGQQIDRFGGRYFRAIYAPTALLTAGALFISFGCLVATFVVSDFSVALVAQHSHIQKPLIYKITGTWGNHEGSMLLFVLIHGIYAAWFAARASKDDTEFQAKVLGVCGGLSLLFIGFILFTSNPFLRLFPTPFTGLGLNPVLQDIGLAIHPPTLYVGYVGLSIPFAMAVAALWQGRVDADWAKAMLPWVSFAWAFLTLGIMLGSVWAYYELGWGGWWAWDPVENVSFMPWLASTALMHTLHVVARNEALSAWAVLLAVLSFALSLVGTFVVRSGVLLSVHAFAVDPTRGAYILAILSLVIGGAFALYGRRASMLFKTQSLPMFSRESALLFNNLLLVLMLLVVALGTFYPLILEALTGDTLTVGPPYFDAFFIPLGLVLALAMGVGPFLTWQSGRQKPLSKLLLWVSSVAVVGGVMGLILTGSVLASLGFACAVALAGLSLAKPFEMGLNRKSVTALALKPAMTLAHFGMAVFIFGVAALSAGTQDTTHRLKIGESLELAGYSVTLTAINQGEGANYLTQTATLNIVKNGWRTQLKPELRYFPAAEETTREADLYVAPNVTIFSVIGEGDAERGWQVRLYIHPFVSWIWAGVGLMALGGLAGVWQGQRRRTGAPRSV